jgi:hypothetical protein
MAIPEPAGGPLLSRIAWHEHKTAAIVTVEETSGGERMSDADATRAGRYVTQMDGYKAFLTARLPPEPPIGIGTDLAARLSRADRGLGYLALFPEP